MRAARLLGRGRKRGVSRLEAVLMEVRAGRCDGSGLNGGALCVGGGGEPYCQDSSIYFWFDPCHSSA